jgi:hypothetical protein
VSGWDPDIDLVLLLNALGEEIAATAEGEVVRACDDTRQSPAEAASEVRELISAVTGDPAETDIDPFDPDGGLKKSRIELDGSRPHGIIAERGGRTHCRQH